MITALNKKNSLLHHYLLISSVFCLFSEAMGGIHFAIMILNLLIMYIILKQLYISKYIIYAYLFLILLGVFSIINDTNELSNLLKQLAGTFISVLYFYNFFKVTKFDFEKIFSTYATGAVIVSFVGFGIFIYEFLAGNTGYRLHSIMMEPAHFCGVLLPAFYYYLKNINQYYYRFSILALAILLSVSSIGYLGVLVCMILLPKKFELWKNVLALTVAFGLGFFAYNVSSNVKFRVDDTLFAAGSMDVSGVNLSTYALISNVFVVKTVLFESPIIGHGFGSHAVSHKRNIDDFYGSQFIPVDLRDINATDANSLFLRLLSELGLTGAFLVIYFVYKNYSGSEDLYIYSRAILIYFFYKLFREGHYYSPEMYFFVIGYIVVHKEFLYSRLNLKPVSSGILHTL